MSVRAAIVTGAASGIGRAIATDLAAQGARVLFADLNAEEGERVAADFSTGAFQRADTAKQSDCDALVARAVRERGVSVIRAHAAGGEADRRSGEGPRDQRGRGDPRHHAGARRAQATAGAVRGRSVRALPVLR